MRKEEIKFPCKKSLKNLAWWSKKWSSKLKVPGQFLHDSYFFFLSFLKIFFFSFSFSSFLLIHFPFLSYFSLGSAKTNKQMYLYVYMYVCITMYVYMYVCITMYVCMYVYVSLCMYICLLLGPLGSILNPKSQVSGERKSRSSGCDLLNFFKKIINFRLQKDKP